MSSAHKSELIYPAGKTAIYDSKNDVGDNGWDTC